MKQIEISPRSNYTKKLEELSFEFHSLENIYWDESAYYKFSMDEINVLEKATTDLYQMMLTAVQHVIDNKLYGRLFINSELIPVIERSWENEEASIYGRFDFAYDGNGAPKLLEFY